ncbi:MAG: ABC transporter substrate-binding protein [Deltaproteobacteria bacterium]|nr:ABC transporter substrate-binding protein [Deltaproteobacteria bacterium]MBF0509307.1 ABC transporter substrate-binding protein [Deltaproteobacteria bacterium]MBF0526111.1 ABC transporter substrate-binding protein [Deltaproteobacteria bacterium]
MVLLAIPHCRTLFAAFAAIALFISALSFQPSPLYAGETPAGANAAPKLITLIKLNDFWLFESGEASFVEGLKMSGFKKGRDYILKTRSAQNDLPTLAGIMDAAVTDGSAAVVTMGGAALQTAITRLKETPVVFQIVDNPFSMGAAKTDTDHLPNVTGVYFPEESSKELKIKLAGYIRALQPKAKTLGAVYTIGFKNSETQLKGMKEGAEKYGFKLEAVGVTSSSELFDALNVLAGKGIKGFVLITGPIPLGTVPTIRSRMDDLGIPLYSTSTVQENDGVLLSLAPDYRVHAKTCGRMAAEILRGKNPADIPLEKPQTPIHLVVNMKVAQRLHISVPNEILRTATGIVKP